MTRPRPSSRPRTPSRRATTRPVAPVASWLALAAAALMTVATTPPARGQAEKTRAADAASDAAQEPAAPERDAAASSTAATPAPFPAGYLGHRALTAALRALEAEHPERVKLTSLGRSLAGRDVWLVSIGGDAAGAGPKVGASSSAAAAPTKPAMLVVANLEADHVVGSQVALGLAARLAKATGKEASWLDRCTVHIVPRLNPDGAERLLGTPAVDLRGNGRPADRDRDGALAEDGPDDLDGDGVVVRMRAKDPATATLVPDEKDPRILRPAVAAKGETPVYADEPEGRDDDGDGLRNEDPPAGVNLNRNWPHRWTEFDPETGFSPASEPEVHALIAWAFAHPEIAAVWSFGLNDNLREEPKKPGSDLDEADLPLFAELARTYQKLAAPRAVGKGGSPAGKGTPAPGATTDGSIAAWAYHQFGAVGLASRLWTTPEIPPPPAAATPAPARAEPADETKKEATAGEKDKEGAAAKSSDAATAKAAKPEASSPAVPDDGEARWLYWNDRVMGGRAFVPLHPFEHPTLGRVEIGGWRPGVRLNPPAGEVDALAATHLSMLRDLADRLPRLSAPEVKVEAKGGGLYAVTAVVRNDGYFPTALAQGVRTRKAPPVLVTLDPGGATVVAGKPRERLDTLAGSGGRKEFRWLLLLPETATKRSIRLDVTCPRAGRVASTVELR